MVFQSAKKILPKSWRDRYRADWHKLSLQFRTTYSKIARQFSRPPFPKLESGEINLHLGCGNSNHPKFINIDGLPASHIHYIRPIDNLSIFKANSINLIYACHCLEHFPHAKVSKIIADWYRVLKDDGILRLSVPDFDLLLKIYHSNHQEVRSIIHPLMGGQNHKLDFHLTVFNRASLAETLKTAGFKQVQEWQPGSEDLTSFDDWSNRQLQVNKIFYPVSLNLEAIK